VLPPLEPETITQHYIISNVNNRPKIDGNQLNLLHDVSKNNEKIKNNEKFKNNERHGYQKFMDVSKNNEKIKN